MSCSEFIRFPLTLALSLKERGLLDIKAEDQIISYLQREFMV
jgi:hypothetical protein